MTQLQTSLSILNQMYPGKVMHSISEEMVYIEMSGKKRKRVQIDDLSYDEAIKLAQNINPDAFVVAEPVVVVVETDIITADDVGRDSELLDTFARFTEFVSEVALYAIDEVETEEEPTATDIAQLTGLPRRIYNALLNDGIDTVEALEAAAEREPDLRRIPGIGDESLIQLTNALGDHDQEWIEGEGRQLLNMAMGIRDEIAGAEALRQAVKATNEAAEAITVQSAADHRAVYDFACIVSELAFLAIDDATAKPTVQPASPAGDPHAEGLNTCVNCADEMCQAESQGPAPEDTCADCSVCSEKSTCTVQPVTPEQLVEASVEIRASVLVSAALDRVMVSFIYPRSDGNGGKEDALSKMLVSHVWESGAGDLCVTGYDARRKDIRTFRLDRIKAMGMVGDPIPSSPKPTRYPGIWQQRHAKPGMSPDKYIGEGWLSAPPAVVLRQPSA